MPTHIVPSPRNPSVPPPGPPSPELVRRWYEDGLGWATAAGPPVALLTGQSFDVLELPVEAGLAVLRRLGPVAPVALRGETMQLLVAAGSSDELPGLLAWLEWGTLAPDLTAVGTDGRIEAPSPPGWRSPQGAAVWLRPPEPGCEIEPALPALTSLGGGGAAPDLVRLVDTAATQCHRARLLRATAQPLAFS